jgi:hypothetical protein
VCVTSLVACCRNTAATADGAAADPGSAACSKDNASAPGPLPDSALLAALLDNNKERSLGVWGSGWAGWRVAALR